MSRIISLPIETGDSVLIEVEDRGTGGGIERAGRGPEELAAEAQQKVEHALEKLKPGIAAIIASLRGATGSPDEIVIEFGVALTAEAQAFIAKSGIGANFNVSAKWKLTREDAQPAPRKGMNSSRRI